MMQRLSRVWHLSRTDAINLKDMKKLNRKLIRGTNWALAGLLSLLGFSGCSDNDDGGLVAEYGTPMASFIVTGKVMDTDGKALEGIQVVVPTVDHCQVSTSGVIYDKPVITEEVRDTLYSKSNGEFEYKYSGFPADTVRIHMKFEDILTEPRYSSDSTSVSFSPKDLKGGERWYRGRSEKNIEVKLKNK